VSSRTAKVGVAYYDIVSVFEADLVTTVSGQVASDFTVTITKNGVIQLGVAFTITEIGSTGHYTFAVPGGFPSAGTWMVLVLVEYNNSTWSSIIEVSSSSVDDVYAALGAGGAGTETVVVQYRDVVNGNALVPDLLINIYDSAGTILVTYGRSDSGGSATFLLNLGTYILRVYKAGVSSSDQEIEVVSGGGTFLLDCESVVVPPPASPSLCRLYADFISQEGLPMEQFKLQVRNLFDPNSSAGLTLIDKVRTYESDEAGHVEFDVLRGSKIQVSFITTPLTRTFRVPDVPVANILTLMGASTDAFQIVR
jgi:hypothetical protein